MKNSTVRFVLALLTLVIGGAAEDMLPKALGVGFPFLLMAVTVVATRTPVALPVLFALAAGAMEDGLSSLPFMTSMSFFLFVAAFVRWTHLSLVAATFVYPVYQVWLSVWTAGMQGAVFSRVLVSIPFGLVTYGVSVAVLLWLEERAGANEEG